MDPQGTWNGSSFTIRVTDTSPHFFHVWRDVWLGNCSVIGNWSSRGNFPPDTDVLFALNPVLEFSDVANHIEQ